MPERRQSLTERIHNLVGSRRSSQPGSSPEDQDYTLYIGRRLEPTLTGEGDFAIILHGQKSKSCEWTYKGINSQGEWETVRNSQPGYLQCDKLTKRTKVGVIKAEDRVKLDAAIRDAEKRGAMDKNLGKGGELGPGKGFAVRVLLCCCRRKILTWDNVQSTLRAFGVKDDGQLYMIQPGRYLSPSEKANFYEDMWN